MHFRVLTTVASLLYCVQMASALAHLHKHGVAHLDVKPDNIYLQVGP